MSTPTSLSVVIRNRNEASDLRHVLAALAKQDYPHEVIVVDNNSIDESRQIASDHGARLVSISNFTYGRALNKGIASANGEYIVLLSAHSLPVGPYFLRLAVAPMADPQIAAVRCLHSAKSGELGNWLNPKRLTIADDYYSDGPLASGCAIRRSVWEKIPFPEEVAAAEDKFWAYQVLNAGYVIYSPAPAVYYYLKRLSPADEVRKSAKEHQAVFERYKLRGGWARTHGSPSGSLRSVVKSLLITAPKAALQIVYLEVLKSYYALSLHRE